MGVLRRAESLSDRELEVFQLIGSGCATRQIAQQLRLSVKTIETYRAHIKEKLKLANGMELIRMAVETERAAEKLMVSVIRDSPNGFDVTPDNRIRLCRTSQNFTLSIVTTVFLSTSTKGQGFDHWIWIRTYTGRAVLTTETKIIN